MHLDKQPTELNRDVYAFVELEGHTIEEAMEAFGIKRRTVYQHINTFRDRTPLPDDYLALLKNRAKYIASKALSVIETNLDSDKPDTHVAVQTAKGTGVFVEKSETEVRTQVIEYDPEEAKRQAIESVLGRVNPDIQSEKSILNTPPLENPSTEKVNDDFIPPVLENSGSVGERLPEGE